MKHFWTMALLLVLSACGKRPPASLTIATINDFHGSLYEQSTRQQGQVAGGLPWLAGTLDAWRAEGTPLILLDGGDVFQGTWPVNATRGMGAVEAFNLLGVDAGAVGNHEFDYGGGEPGEHPLRGALENAGLQARWAWLSANIVDSSTGQPWGPEGFQATTIIERGGLRIGVIGLTTTDTPETTLLKNVADLRFTDPVVAVKHHAERLRAERADLIAVVGHLSGSCPKRGKATDPCVPDGEIGRLLTELPPGTMDLLVTGHAHTTMAFRHDDTLVLQSGSKGRSIGRVDLVFDNGNILWENTRVRAPVYLVHSPTEPGCAGGTFDTTPLRIDEWTVTPNQEALALIERLEAKTGSLCTPAGCTAVAMPRNRNGGSVLGSTVADAMRAAFPDADLAVTNAGGLRADLPKGQVLREHLHGVMPFDNRLVLVEMTGAKLSRLLEIGTSGAHGPLQLSGGSVSIHTEEVLARDLNGDGAQDEWETNRVCGAVVDGKPIEAESKYTVITTDFLLGGGDHLTPAFEGARKLADGPLLRDHLIQWFTHQDSCVDAAPDAMRRLITNECPKSPAQETETR
jgi:5'-nucleotidase